MIFFSFSLLNFDCNVHTAHFNVSNDSKNGTEKRIEDKINEKIKQQQQQSTYDGNLIPLYGRKSKRY